MPKLPRPVKGKKQDNKLIYVLLLIIFITGSFVRLYPAAQFDIPLKYDSYYHLRIAELVKETGTVPSWEPWPYGGRPHLYPPLYHITLAGISTLTNIPLSELIRFFLPIVSCVIILAVFWLVRKFRDEKTALLASFFVAISPYLISSAYDSPQVIGILLGIFSVYFLLKEHFYKAGLLLAFICLFNPFSAISFAFPFFVWLFLKKDLKGLLKTFAFPAVFVALWYLPRMAFSYCSESVLGPHFIIKATASALWQEAAIVFFVLIFSLLIVRFLSKIKHDRFWNFWSLWVLLFAVLHFSFVLTALLHPWRHSILLSFGFSILIADVLARVRLRELLILLYAILFIGGLLVLFNLNEFGPALEENEHDMIEWADYSLPNNALILAHHDICSNIFTFTNRTCLLDIFFECIPDKQAWYDYEQLFWSQDPDEVQSILDFYDMTHILYRAALPYNKILEETTVNKLYASWQCEPEGDLCYKDASAYEVIRHKHLLIRMDDIWPTSDDDRHGYTFENLENTINVIEKHNTTALLAATPFFYDEGNNRTLELAIDNKVVELLKDLADDGWEIAMHGYSHHCPGILGCEFDGTTVEENVAMLTEGKEYLEDLLGVKIVKFVPPKNRMPQNLATALEEVGMQGVDDVKWYDPVGRWYWAEGTVEWIGFEPFMYYYEGISLHYNTITGERLSELDGFLAERLGK